MEILEPVRKLGERNLEGILDWGVRVILWFQQASPALDLPFKALTLMGNEMFYLVFFPLVYWCVDRRVGARLIILFLLSSSTNAVAKQLAGQPRPFEYDPTVQRLWPAGGKGFPSGHTQSAVVIWGYLACQFRKTWFRVVCGSLIVLIPLSRVYLGVHFPTDLLGGYLLGAALLALYLRFQPAVEDWLAGRNTGIQLVAALARRHQVLCITHLPQIAKFADHHFKISKQVVSGRTRTVIAPLADDERTREIARMLGGEKITRVEVMAEARP